MEGRLRQGNNSKRVFGRDITNLERRGKVHSITEKTSSILDYRKPSKSFEKKQLLELKDTVS